MKKWIPKTLATSESLTKVVSHTYIIQLCDVIEK